MADGILWQLAAQAGQNAFANGPDAYMEGVKFRKQQDIESNRKSILQQITAGPNGGAANPNVAIGQLIRTGDLAGASQLAQASKLLQPETTDEIREYHLDQQQRAAAGKPPLDFTTWKTNIKTASAPKINNVVNMGDSEYAKVLGKNNAEGLISINKAGSDATNKLNTLNAMESYMNDPNFYSGFAGPTKLRVNQALASLGIANPNVASATEAFQALSNKSVLDQAGGSLGTGFSNADRDYIQGTTANVQNTPEGNRQIINIQRKVAQRQQQISQLARDYTAKNGKFDVAGFNDFLAGWAEKNPLFPQGAPAPSATKPQPQPQQAIPPAGKRQINQIYQTPRGPAYWRGDGWELVQ